MRLFLQLKTSQKCLENNDVVNPQECFNNKQNEWASKGKKK